MLQGESWTYIYNKIETFIVCIIYISHASAKHMMGNNDKLFYVCQTITYANNLLKSAHPLKGIIIFIWDMIDNIHRASISVSHNYIISKFLVRIAIISRVAFRDNKIHLPWNARGYPRCGLSRKSFTDHAERYALGTLLDPEKCTRLLRLSRHTIGGPSAIVAILAFHDAILLKIGKESLYFEIHFFLFAPDTEQLA